MSQSYWEEVCRKIRVFNAAASAARDDVMIGELARLVTGHTPITTEERTVAQLIIQNMTGKEILDRLFARRDAYVAEAEKDRLFEETPFVGAHKLVWEQLIRSELL